METKMNLWTVKNPIHMMRISMLALMMVIFSSAALAQSTVVEIVVNSPDHTTLEAAVLAAGLADDLSGEGPFTVFAPSDAAFAALPEGTVATLLEDPNGALSEILLYHVVSAKALSTDLSNGQTIETLNGDMITVKFKNGKVYIDGAMVTVADIEADNGVVHVIDAVITPSAEMADASSSSSAKSSQDCAK